VLGVLQGYLEWKAHQDLKELQEEPGRKESLDCEECPDYQDLPENYLYFLLTSCSKETLQPRCLSEDLRETFLETI
jgi:hypothetical protein